MIEMLKKILPPWLLGIALLLFVVALFIPLIPGVSLQLNGQPFGFSRTPAWSVTEQVENKTGVDIKTPVNPTVLPVNANEGFCFLTYVGGTFASKDQSAEVYSDGVHWWLRNIPGGGSINSRATCIKFAAKWDHPIKTNRNE